MRARKDVRGLIPSLRRANSPERIPSEAFFFLLKPVADLVTHLPSCALALTHRVVTWATGSSCISSYSIQYELDSSVRCHEAQAAGTCRVSCTCTRTVPFA